MKLFYAIAYTIILLPLSINTMEQEKKFLIALDNPETIKPIQQQQSTWGTENNVVVQGCLVSNNYHFPRPDTAINAYGKCNSLYLPLVQCWVPTEEEFFAPSIGSGIKDGEVKIDDDEKSNLNIVKKHIIFSHDPYARRRKPYGFFNTFDGINDEGFAVLATSAIKQGRQRSFLYVLDTTIDTPKKEPDFETEERKIHCDGFTIEKELKNSFITACALSNGAKKNSRILYSINNPQKPALELLEIIKTEKNAMASLINMKNNYSYSLKKVANQSVSHIFSQLSFINHTTAIGLSKEKKLFHIKVDSKHNSLIVTEIVTGQNVQHVAIDPTNTKNMLFITEQAQNNQRKRKKKNALFLYNQETKKTRQLAEEYVPCENISNAWLANNIICLLTGGSSLSNNFTFFEVAEQNESK